MLYRGTLPRLPVLSLAAFHDNGERPLPSLLDVGAGNARLVSSGRVAIALALQALEIGPGDTVLIPAYHSPSMVPPVLWRGARAAFYRIGADTAVDLADLDGRWDPSVKALMVTHYFGFMQDLAPLRAWCNQRGVALLEDCAHCFFGHHQGQPIGTYGDYAIGSSMKFYPIFEGGCLVSARHPLDGIALRPAGLGFEAKATLAVFEHSFAHGRLPVLHTLLKLPLRLKDAVWRTLKARRASSTAAGLPSPQVLAPSSSDSSYDFDPRWLNKHSAWFSRWVLQHTSASRITGLRRRHYQALQAAVTDLPSCHPLHAQLPDGVCPWLFPLWIDQPETVFNALQAAGVPVVRFGHTAWPDMPPDLCPQAAALGQHVLALPCHQDLTAGELAWLCSTLRAVLNSVTASRAG